MFYIRDDTLTGVGCVDPATLADREIIKTLDFAEIVCKQNRITRYTIISARMEHNRGQYGRNLALVKGIENLLDGTIVERTSVPQDKRK